MQTDDSSLLERPDETDHQLWQLQRTVQIRLDLDSTKPGRSHDPPPSRQFDRSDVQDLSSAPTHN